MEKVLGIDVGATGIKGAVVDLKKGELISERIKIPTPSSGKPSEMIDVMAELVKRFDWGNQAVGVGFPAIIKNNCSWSASNIDDSWIGFPIKDSIEKALNTSVSIINDADAAGLAELKYGKGQGLKGTWMLLTLGTGIGSALFLDDKLIPNTEFGRLHFRDSVAERYASNSARKNKDLSWKEYGKELNDVLEYINFIFSPNMIILGGGISKKFESFSNYINSRIEVCAAEKYNNAGIIGAAIATKL